MKLQRIKHKDYFSSLYPLKLRQEHTQIGGGDVNRLFFHMTYEFCLKLVNLTSSLLGITRTQLEEIYFDTMLNSLSISAPFRYLFLQQQPLLASYGYPSASSSHLFFLMALVVLSGNWTNLQLESIRIVLATSYPLRKQISDFGRRLSSWSALIILRSQMSNLEFYIKPTLTQRIKLFYRLQRWLKKDWRIKKCPYIFLFTLDSST